MGGHGSNVGYLDSNTNKEEANEHNLFLWIT